MHTSVGQIFSHFWDMKNSTSGGQNQILKSLESKPPILGIFFLLLVSLTFILFSPFTFWMWSKIQSHFRIHERGLQCWNLRKPHFIWLLRFHFYSFSLSLSWVIACGLNLWCKVSLRSSKTDWRTRGGDREAHFSFRILDQSSFSKIKH